MPVAFLGFVHPAIAEAAMAFSSVNVVRGSARLRKVDLSGVPFSTTLGKRAAA